MKYEIKISLEKKPINLKFYYDEGCTDEIKVENDIMTISGFISWKEQQVKDETVYWQWPTQTGITEDEILKNDLLDTESMNDIMKMQISATGKQVAKIDEYRVTLDTCNYVGCYTYEIPSSKIEEDGILMVTLESDSDSSYKGPYIPIGKNGLVVGEKYRIELEAKASRDISVKYGWESAEDFAYHTCKKINLTENYQTYYLEATYSKKAMDSVILYDDTWKAGDTLYIKSLKISKIVTNGDKYGELWNKKIEGYIFKGWYTEKDGGIEITSSTRVDLSQDIILYPHWERREEM